MSRMQGDPNAALGLESSTQAVMRYFCVSLPNHAQTGSNNAALQEGGKENTPPCKRRKSAACLNFNAKTASQQANRPRVATATSSLFNACLESRTEAKADKVKGDSLASSEATPNLGRPQVPMWHPR